MRMYVGVADDIQSNLFKSRAKRAAHLVAAQAERDMRSLVPTRSGRLRASAQVDGRKVHWTTPYAGELYYGILMVDPISNVGGFPYRNYGAGVFRSRRGVKKVPSGRQLVYTTGEKNWIAKGKEMYMDRWLKMARRALLEQQK